MAFLNLRSKHRPLQLLLFPTVTTQAVTDITQTSATGNGTVVNEGGSATTERGIVYSLNPQPTTADTKVTSGSGTGSFTASLSPLTPGQTYYVRAYAINSTGTSYGDQVQFSASQVIVNLDQFWQLPNQPKMMPAVLVQEGFFCIDPFQLTQAERSTPDRYMPRQSEPRWSVKPLVPEGHYSFDLQKEFPINMDKWFKETETPPKTFKPLVPEGWFTIDPSQLTQAERISLDKWFKESEDPIFIKFVRQTESTYPLIQIEVISVDKWFKELEKPLPLPMMRQSEIVRSFVQAEYVTVDKYHLLPETFKDVIGVIGY